MSNKGPALLKGVSASFEDECVLTIGTSALVNDMVESGSALVEGGSALVEDKSALVEGGSALVEGGSPFGRSEDESVLMNDGNVLADGGIVSEEDGNVMVGVSILVED